MSGRASPAVDDTLWREDLTIQLKAAQASADRGHYATARAELRSAIAILNSIDRLHVPRGGAA